MVEPSLRTYDFLSPLRQERQGTNPRCFDTSPGSNSPPKMSNVADVTGSTEDDMAMVWNLTDESKRKAAGQSSGLPSWTSRLKKSTVVVVGSDNKTIAINQCPISGNRQKPLEKSWCPLVRPARALKRSVVVVAKV